MPARTFHVVAHRGDSSQAPENTLRAFEAALRAGADEVECDIRVTKDGVPVLCHDADLARILGLEVQVKDLTWEELKAKENEKGERPRSSRIPTLDEAVTKYLAKIPLALDLKVPGAVVPAILTMQRFAEQGAFERIWIHSFVREILIAARVLDARVRLGYLLEAHSLVTPAEVKHLGALVILPNWEDATKNFVDESHKLGLIVRVWGARTPDAVKKALEAGADGAIYDDPTEALQLLRENGLRGDEGAAPVGAAAGNARGAAEAEKVNGRPVAKE